MATHHPTKRAHSAPRKRRRKPMAASGKRRRSPARSKGLLSDMFNPTIAMNSAKNTLAAGLGGFGAVLVDRSILPQGAGKGMKLLVGLGAGFLLNSFGMSNIGQGFTGGQIALAFQNGLLNDNNEFADSDVLSDSPMVLDEDGVTPMILEEGDGEPYYRYLTEEEMQEYEYAQSY